MATTKPFLEISDLRGGRNGGEVPWKLAENECVEALNVDWWDGSIGRKRGGASALSLSGFSGTTPGFIGRHVPGADETAAEFWLVDTANTPAWARLAASATWASVTPTDTWADVDVKDMCAVSFNGKYVIAGNSNVNRLHCWDGTSVRRMGLARTGTPTVAESAGAVTDVRKYKTAVTVQVSGVTTRRSELSVFSAAATLSTERATVTLVSVPSDGETHWELYAYSDDDDYATGYLVATTAIATTTAEDNNATLSGDAPPDDGVNVVPPSCKYLVADDARLLMGGAWETSAANTSQTTPQNNRVWWTDRLGSSDVGDDERVSGGAGPVNTAEGVARNYLDVEEAITGMGGPLHGSTYVFSYGRAWKYTPTFQSTAPYARIALGGIPGCIRHHTIVRYDEDGQPAIAWLSAHGPYAIGARGARYLKKTHIQDIWDTVNLAASTVVAHGVYYPAKHQIWWWIATGSANVPDVRIVYDTVSGAWAKHTGLSAEGRASALFSTTVGATMSRDLKPYVVRNSGAAVWKADTGTDDAGTDFQSSITTKPYAPWGLGRRGGISQEALLMAEAASGVTIQLSMIVDYGAVSDQTSTCLLTAAGSETRVIKKFEGSQVSDASVLQFQIGDSAAADASWVLDALVYPASDQGAR